MKSSTRALAARGVAACAAVPVRPAVSSRKSVVVRAAAPLVGSKAPDFKAQAVVDQEFVEVSLSKYKGKYVVLFF